jgi:PAS domain S-box-containing protein
MASLLTTSIRARLVALAILAAAPMAALHAWTVYADARREAQWAHEKVLHLAETTAAETARFIGQGRNILAGLAKRPAILALDPARCDPILADFLGLAPRFANVLTLNAGGDLVCSGVPRAAGRPARVDPKYYLRRALESGNFTVGTPAKGFITGRWVVTLAQPLREAGGVVAVSIDLQSFPVLPGLKGLSPDATVAIVGGDGTILAHSKEAGRLVGTSDPGHPATRSLFATRAGTTEEAGFDGRLRVRGHAPVAGTDWVAVASLPSSEVFAPFRRDVLASVLAAILALGLAAWLAVRRGREIADPVVALSRTANAVAAGNAAARAPVAGPREIATVAREFNRMLEARPRAEAELRESERRYRDMLDAVDLVSVMLDREGRILYANDFLLRLTGWRREEITGGDWFALFIPPELGDLRSLFVRMLAGDELMPHHENEILTRGGERRLVHWNNSVLRSPEGAIIGSASLGEDITERRRTEASLRESEGKLRLFMRSMPAAMAMFDLEMRYVAFSERWISDYGLSGQDLAGRSHYEVFPDLPELWKDVHRRCLAGASESAEEDRFPREDGSVGWLRWEVHPWHQGSGAIGGIIIFSEDITARKRAENHAHESDERLRLVVHAANVGLWDWDLKTNAVYYSPEWKGQIGYEDHEIANEFEEWRGRVHPDDLGRAMETVSRYIDRPWPGYSQEFRFRHKDGSYRAILTHASVIVDDDGKPVRMMGSHVDITERVHAEQALAASERRLRSVIDGLGPQMLVGLLTVEGVILEANAPALAAAGLVLGDVAGTLVEESYWFSYSEEARRTIREAVVKAASGEGTRFDIEIRVRDESRIAVDFSMQPLRDGSGEIVYLVPSAIVITERKAAEEALRESQRRLQALTRRVLEVQESERRLVARELHDEVGGALTAVKLNVQSLRGTGKRRVSDVALADALGLVDGAIAAIRSLSLELRPAVLDDLGLIPALRWYCGRQSQRAGLPVEPSLDAIDLKRAPQLESTCYRVVQESVTNAIRHAGAEAIRVALRREDGAFTLEIRDDGAGFDVAAARQRALAGESSGLLNIEERVTLAGGQLRIESGAGEGTRVWARFMMPEGGFEE